MEYQILGPLEVREAGAVRPIPGIKERALLGLLVVEAGTVVSSDRMVFELWGDEPPPTARRTLRTHVSRLRRALGADHAIVTQRPGYALEAPVEAIDAARFEVLADLARRQAARDPAAAARAAAEGLGLWRGPALNDLDGFPFAEAESRRLAERRLLTIEVHADALLRLGGHDEVIAALVGLVEEHPFHERFWTLLMLALHRAGRSGDALRAYSRAETALGETLGIGPSAELRSLERAIVMEDPVLLAGPGTPAHNLPAALSSFIGREQEMDALVDALGRARLVTLVGPGGGGKSRLALEVAGRMLGRFPDGVWRTELASLRDSSAVPAAVSAALGDPASHAADPSESLAGFLQDRETLLLLDNCEHLLDAVAALVATLLSRCPNVRIVATSREPLRVAGETVWMVPPLQLPDPGDPVPDQQDAEAFRLFVERSAATRPDFVVNADHVGAVTGICRALAGLPLAIELAASRVAAHTVEELALRLATGLDALAGHHRAGPARHRTMRASIDWSVQALDADLRNVFEVLAAFTGAWTVDDATAVLAGVASTRGIAAADAVADLVDRSLVQVVRRDRKSRYRLLEPIRQFAVELLTAREDEPEVRLAHALHYLERAEAGDAAIRGHEQQPWLGRLEADHENIRAALRWSIDGGAVSVGLRLVAAMGWFWFMAGHWRDAESWLDESLGAAGDDWDVERLLAVTRTGGIQIIRRNDEPVLSMLDTALARSRTTGDRVSEAWCLHLIAHSRLHAATQETRDMLVEARELFAEAGRPWEVAWSDRYIGDAHAALGEIDRGVETQLASIEAFRSLGDRWSTAYGFHNLAAALLVSHGPTEARPYYERCRRLADEIGDPVWTAHGILGMGLCDFMTGSGDAATLLADAEDRLRLIGDDNCLINATAYLGRLRERSGDRVGAGEHFLEAVRIAERIGKDPAIAMNLDRIARVAAEVGAVAAARRLVGGVERLVAQGDVVLHPLHAGEHEALLDEVGVADALDEPLDRLISCAVAVVADLGSGAARATRDAPV